MGCSDGDQWRLITTIFWIPPLSDTFCGWFPRSRDYDPEIMKAVLSLKFAIKWFLDNSFGTSANWADTDGYLPPEILT